MYPSDISGINVEKKLIGEGTSLPIIVYDIVFSDDTNHKTFMRLLAELPPETMFMFYDAEYPSPSDPGAFIKVKRNGNEYLMERTNHGWANGWESISFENLTAYLSKCQKYNMGSDSMSQMRFYPKSESSSKKKKWWMFWK
ncbi:MAG: hypothetical protein GY755_05280 [Chloroflexi bacterium]|nr:hypothetical protein [Chloroflexota bacterium]